MASPPEIWQVPLCCRCSGVGNKSIQCSHCMLWVHKRKCSGITKWLVGDPNYVCRRCNDEAWPIAGRTGTEMDVDSTMLDVACPCYQMCGLGKVRETLACPNHQTSLTCLLVIICITIFCWIQRIEAMSLMCPYFHLCVDTAKVYILTLITVKSLI